MPRPLTPREKRTLRLGFGGLAVYLVLFYGTKGWSWLEARRAEYAAVGLSAEQVQLEILREQSKALRLQNLKTETRIDLAKLSEETAVGEARGAIQKAAQACGLQISSAKESPGRGAGGDLATIQLEGLGPSPGVLQFLHNLRSLGYPVVVDKLQIHMAGVERGQAKLSLSATVLSFKDWKGKEPTGA
jgi:hypothetical protein